jgi:hypothetical protein
MGKSKPPYGLHVAVARRALLCQCALLSADGARRSESGCTGSAFLFSHSSAHLHFYPTSGPNVTLALLFVLPSFFHGLTVSHSACLLFPWTAIQLLGHRLAS